MSGRCLGDKVADLADGRLGTRETARAFAHVADCSRCRAALAAQHTASSRLAESSAPIPTQDLLDRLGRISDPVVAPEPAAPSAPIPAQAGAADRPLGRGPSGPAGVRPAGGAPMSVPSPRRRRGRVVLASAAGAAALAVVAVVGGGTATLGTSVAPRPSLAPVIDTLANEHVASSDQMPLSGPRIVTVGFSDPSPAPSSSP